MNYRFLLTGIIVFFHYFSFSQTFNPLINVDEFKKLDSISYTLIDLRKPKEFKEGHIKNAINIWRTQIVDSNLVYGGMKISRDTLQALFSNIGVKSTDKIIIYDAKGDVDAARLWWLLFTYGHKNVSLLNGGLTEWQNGKNNLTSKIINKDTTNYQFPNKEDYSLVVTKKEVIQAIKDSNTLLIDTRTLDEYSGETLKKGAYRKGRIPTSIFIDWCEAINYNGDRKFKSIDKLKKVYNLDNIGKSHPIITYCQSGVRSAHTTFVLTQILGFTNVRNYDGSWIEWSYDPRLPIQDGKPTEKKETNQTVGLLPWLFIICPLLLVLLIIFLAYKKKMKHLLLVVFLGCSIISQAQKSYAKQILDTLCSNAYHGRGYVNNGVEKAANYLERELKKIGVKAFPNQKFQQDYFFDVNTFPYKIQVKLNTKDLVAGQDYILNSNSGSSIGTFNVINVNSKNFLTVDTQPQDKKSIVVYNFSNISDKDSISYFYGMAMRSTKVAPVIWVQDSKLTYSVGRFELENAMIIVKYDAYFSCTTITLDIKNKYIQNYKSQNVIGYIPSVKKCKLKSEKLVVISAHFDHLGQMGQAIFPGANDNASGVAMLLSMAKYYQDNPQEYAIVFCFFSGEEAGLEGSKFFVSHPYFNLKKIEFVLNIDIMGGASTGITVVNGSKHTKLFNKLVEINTEKNYLNKIGKRGETSNSDHYFFSKNNVPAFFIYSVGTCSNYHDIYDKTENAPLAKFDEVQFLLTDFIKKL